MYGGVVDVHRGIPIVVFMHMVHRGVPNACCTPVIRPVVSQRCALNSVRRSIPIFMIKMQRFLRRDIPNTVLNALILPGVQTLYFQL